MYQAGKRGFFIVILTLSCFFYTQNLVAQFAPSPSNLNTTAIHKDNSQFSFWANEIEIQRSWQNIADTTLGKTTFGTENNVLGKANNLTISLGDSGSAIIQFPFPIYNITGFDFAVFENAFAQNNANENSFFMELAFVEVSENGIDFISFESTSNTDTTIQTGSFSTLNCTKINNLAGKYPLNFGTPFDLEELGLDSILAIRITDVVGSLNHNFASFDSQGNKINDPYPTVFPSGGFDLNAIGALNQPNIIIDPDIVNAILNISRTEYHIFPNPIKQGNTITIQAKNNDYNYLEIYSVLGELVYKNYFKTTININTQDFTKGIYIAKINATFNRKIIVE